MPIISCPTCAMKLTVADDDIGHKVECSGCQVRFVADDGSAPKADDDDGRRKPYSYRRERDDDRDDDDRPRRSRRDDDDRDDDDDPDGRYRRSRRRTSDERDYEERYGARPQTGMGTSSMVLGIVSLPMLLMFFPAVLITGLLGLIFGCIALKTEGRRQGITGIICSIIALVLMVLITVAYIWFVYYMVSTRGGMGPGGGGAVTYTTGTGPGRF